jgi:hypothetical protein
MNLRNLRFLFCTCTLLAAISLSAKQPPAPQSLELRANATNKSTVLVLVGKGASQQLGLMGKMANGADRDFTHHANYKVEPANIASVDSEGFVRPLGNGKANISANVGGKTASIAVEVREFGQYRAVNFANEIVPVFTKYGCNGGGCHGKSGGQNGFRLSLLGFEPQEDYEYIVHEGRGRRVFPAAPDRSLLLLKATNEKPHGGGARMHKDTLDYQTVFNWVGQGMPYGKPDDPTLEKIEVFPPEKVMAMNSDQQLVVTATYSDGSTRDVSRTSVFEVNEEEVGEVTENGHITVFEQPGDAAVMIRYQDKVTVFQATVPLGAPIENLPKPRNFIDELVFEKLRKVGMPPSESSDDATFLRRVTIDIAGRIPSLEESTAFLENKDPQKRDQVIDRLLASPDYADNFANKWTALLRNKRNKESDRRGNYAFHRWIRKAFNSNMPYDQFARQILAASGDMTHNPPVAWYREVKTTQQQLEDASQLFLGTRIQCAQCHHHPFEKWSQHDYYSFSAFFSQVGRKPGRKPGEEMIYHKRGVAKATNKKNNKPVQPAGLGAAVLDLGPDEDPRQSLVDWMSAKDNKFFAHTLVNRYWKHFFSRGLVEPEDDMRETNPATNPALLNSLANHFIESSFNLKGLIRSICQSRTYQLSAEPNQHNAKDKHNYSRYYPKRLQAEVLYDAIDELTGLETSFKDLPTGTRAIQLPDNSWNSSVYFLSVFGRPDSASACECERSSDASLAQSLHLLNSKDIQNKLSSSSGRARKLAGEKERKDEEKIKELYLRAFSRSPHSNEISLATEYLNRKIKDDKGVEKPADRTQSYEDIVWALFNTKEFLFNH